jgi:hypothetical protein
MSPDQLNGYAKRLNYRRFFNGASRARTGDLLLANSAAQEVSGAHWASMAELTAANRRVGCRCWPLFSESASSPRRPKTASQLGTQTTLCAV